MGATPITETRRLAAELVHGRADEPRHRQLAICAAAVLVPVLAFALGLRGIELLIPLVAALVVVVLVARDTQQTSIAMPKTRTKGPEQVAGIVAALGPNWHAFRNVSLGSGRLEHVLVGPGGVVMLKTEAERNLFRPKTIDPILISRICAEKGALERVSGLFVEPILVIGHAHMGKPVAGVGGVTVLPVSELDGYLERIYPVLDDREVAELGEAFRLALEVDSAPSAPQLQPFPVAHSQHSHA
jgi:hypothetical protein